MKAVKFKKDKDNVLGYEVLELINIVFNGKELEYFFIADNEHFTSVSHQDDVTVFYENYSMIK